MARGYKRKTKRRYQSGGPTTQRPPLGPGARTSAPRNLRPRRAIPRPPGPGLPPPDWRKQYGHATRQRGGRMNFQTGGHTLDPAAGYGGMHTHNIPKHRHVVLSDPSTGNAGGALAMSGNQYQTSLAQNTSAQDWASDYPIWTDESQRTTNMTGRHTGHGVHGATPRGRVRRQRGGGINLKTIPRRK